MATRIEPGASKPGAPLWVGPVQVCPRNGLIRLVRISDGEGERTVVERVEPAGSLARWLEKGVPPKAARRRRTLAR